MNRCCCARPHPVLTGGRYEGSCLAESMPLDEGVARLDLWTCAVCRSTRAVAVPVAPEPSFPRLIACGPVSDRVLVGGPVWLTPRGYVHLEDLLPSEAAELAPTLTPPELQQLTGLAWAAAMMRLGVNALCRPTRRAA